MLTLSNYKIKPSINDPGLDKRLKYIYLGNHTEVSRCLKAETSFEIFEKICSVKLFPFLRTEKAQKEFAAQSIANKVEDDDDEEKKHSKIINET